MIADPRLGTLTENGGLTLTHALLPNSPAINAYTADCPSNDQRGDARPQGSACDIGAFEVVVPPLVLNAPVGEIRLPYDNPTYTCTSTNCSIEPTTQPTANDAARLVNGTYHV